jgi:hypothetical protein
MKTQIRLRYADIVAGMAFLEERSIVMLRGDPFHKLSAEGTHLKSALWSRMFEEDKVMRVR